MTTAEAKTLLDVLIPLAPTGTVIDIAAFRGWAREAMEHLPNFFAVGATFGSERVFVLPANKGYDDGRFIVARQRCGT